MALLQLESIPKVHLIQMLFEGGKIQMERGELDTKTCKGCNGCLTHSTHYFSVRENVLECSHKHVVNIVYMYPSDAVNHLHILKNARRSR